MISKEEIQNLAQLSRLKLTDEEIVALQKDFDSILGYVGQVSAVADEQTSSSNSNAPRLVNVMRADEPRAADEAMAGKQAAILAQAPKRLPAQAGEGDYFVVRKIIERDG